MNDPITAVNNWMIMYDLISTSERYFLDGYEMEKNRLKDLDTECCHYKFGSVGTYFKYIHDLIDLQQNREDDPEYHNLDEYQKTIKHIFGHLGLGCCKQCSLWIVTNIKHITNFTKYAKQKHEFHWHEEDIFDDKQAYIICHFINTMFHAHTFNFIFNQSNIWLNMINKLSDNLIYLTISVELELDKQLILNKHNNVLTTFSTDQVDVLEEEFIEYKPVMLVLFQLLRNIKMIKRRNWRGIIIRGNSFVQWLYFVRKQLKYKLYLKHSFGFETMQCMLILICFGLQHMSKKYKWESIMKKLFGFCGIQKWFQDIEQIAFDYAKSGFDDIRHCGFIKTILTLKHDVYFNAAHCKFVEFGKEVFNRKWHNMQCQNRHCDARRFTVTLMKCKSCQVARYCSKRCQKIDWNKYNHKLYCKKMTKMRKENSLFWQADKINKTTDFQTNPNFDMQLEAQVRLSNFYPSVFS
eukprot:387305_1